MSSPGNSNWNCRCSVGVAGNTFTAYCSMSWLPQTIRLTVPEVLPSTSTCCGSMTVASAISGFVTAMRVTGNPVCTTVDPPATTSSVGNAALGATIAAAASDADAWAGGDGNCAASGVEASVVARMTASQQIGR